MGSRLRMFEPHKVFEVVSGTVDREFLFLPNSHPNDPLLRYDCPLDAFDPTNDVLPQPSTFNIIGYAFARALELSPVNLHCSEQNTSHLHTEISGDEKTIANIPSFYRNAHSSIARQINKTYDREGHVFSGRYRATCCDDDEAAEEKLYYAITNIVKDGLLDTQNGRTFLSAYPTLAAGKKLKFWKINWRLYYKKGGPRVKKHRPKDYIEWKELDFTWIAPLLKLSEPQRQARIRQQTKKRIEKTAETMRREGRKPLGHRGLSSIDPRSRPKRPRERTRQPLCHASTAKGRKAYKKRYIEFHKAYIQASADFRSGKDYYREFPLGSCRPPLLKVCVEDDL